MQSLRWMRVPGDVLFAIGALLFAWFILGLITGHSYEKGDSLKSDLELPENDEVREAVLTNR